MSANAKRLVGVIAGAVIVCVLLGLYIGLYLTNSSVAGRRAVRAPARSCTWARWPPPRQRRASDAGSPTTRSMPTSGHWRHATTYVLPANTLVHVTIYQFDGQSGLRNPFISQATGTVGGNFVLDGKPTQAIDPDPASHVFAIPQIGLSVPLAGIPDSAKNPCNNAPCSLS